MFFNAGNGCSYGYHIRNAGEENSNSNQGFFITEKQASTVCVCVCRCMSVVPLHCRVEESLVREGVCGILTKLPHSQEQGC